MNIWTKAFWKSVVERILATAAFALVGFLSVDGFDLRTAHWGDIAQAVGVAGAERRDQRAGRPRDAATRPRR
jgi:hypothetical protein